MAKWKVRLSGDRIDLQNLPGVLPSDFLISEEDNQFYLVSLRFESCTRDGEVFSLAKSGVDAANKIAPLYLSGAKPIAVGAVIRLRDDGSKEFPKVFAGAEISTRASLRASPTVIRADGTVEEALTNGELGPQVELAIGDENVQEALRYYSQEPRGETLNKVFEVICADLGGGDRELAEEFILKNGWATLEELKGFSSLHDPAVLGEAARHARVNRSPTKHDMSLSIAKEFIRRLLKSWIEMKVDCSHNQR